MEFLNVLGNNCIKMSGITIKDNFSKELTENRAQFYMAGVVSQSLEIYYHSLLHYFF